VIVPVEPFAANGNLGLNCLSQPRGKSMFLHLLTESTTMTGKQMSQQTISIVESSP
jgi:hypothetical protein